MTALLEVRSVAVRFGGVMALSGVDLDVQKDSITGLIGPNGAGKTTLFNVICGIRQPTTGVVLLDNEEINGVPTQKRSAMGIGRTFQRLELFTTLSVFDNVLVAAELARVSNPHAVARADRTSWPYGPCRHNCRRTTDRISALTRSCARTCWASEIALA